MIGVFQHLINSPSNTWDAFNEGGTLTMPRDMGFILLLYGS